MKIYLNPGHDRKRDSGAVNTNLNLRECDIAYALAQAVKTYLERHDAVVVIGQDDDLYHICDEANAFGADYFISIHFNAFNTRATGTETLVSGSLPSLLLGHSLQANVRAVLCLPDRGLKERPTLFVLRNTVMPAVLVEVCFLDNDYDVRLYEQKKDDVARAIATAIVQYHVQAGQAAA